MASHEHMILLEDLKRTAWAKTSPVAGQLNSWEFRKDCLGNLIRFQDYGKRTSPFGWELDFIKPRHLGGDTNPENLQALHWKSNAAKSDQIPASIVAAVEEK